MKLKLYHQASYLPEIPLDKRNPLVIARLLLAIILVVMIALLES